MPADSLTIEAKARLFDQLTVHQAVITEALTSYARVRADELIISHKAGFRSGGRGRTKADFGLESISAAHEIITGAPLKVDQFVKEARLNLESALAPAIFATEVAEVGQN